MILDMTVSLGSMLNAAALLIGFVVAFTKINGRIDLLAQRIESVEETLRASRASAERMAVIETMQGTQAQMIATVQADIADMKRGRGFLIGPREFAG